MCFSAADINKLDVKGMTPLHWAATKGNYEAAIALIDHGSNLLIKGIVNWICKSQFSVTYFSLPFTQTH
jgi:ankyrin repeat protein